jgi:ribosomal protein L37E
MIPKYAARIEDALSGEITVRALCSHCGFESRDIDWPALSAKYGPTYFIKWLDVKLVCRKCGHGGEFIVGPPSPPPP